MKKNIYVYGHKNPDSDSICSAIGAAYLKNKMVEEGKLDPVKHFGLYEDGVYIPRAAGEPGDETKAILSTFDVAIPEVVKDVRRQIEDLEIKEVYSISPETSLLEALELMEEKNENTLFVVEDNILKGMVTYKDIARAYMDLSEKSEFTCEKISYDKIKYVLDGKILKEGSKDFIERCEINIMEADKDLADNTIKSGNLVILSPNDEKVKYLAEKGVSAIVLSNAGQVSEELINTLSNDVLIISSPYDIYDISRLIKQATPVDNFMVLSDNIVLFRDEEFVDDVQETIKNSNFREFPVIDKSGNPIGVIDKASLLTKSGKRIVMVDHNEKNQAVVGIHECDVIEIIDHHKLSTVETNKPINVTTKQVGCTGTIVFEMYENADIEIPKRIAGVLCGAIISDTMHFKSPTCTEDDVRAAKLLSEISGVRTEDLWKIMLDASLNMDKKTDEEILYQDYKKFNSGGFSFGIGQVIVADEKGADDLAKRIQGYMEQEYKECDVDLMGLLITDVERDGSELLFLGDAGKGILESAFKKEISGNRVFLEGVVSRKKQIVPQILTVLEQ